jgi:uncharacterized protein YacL
MFIHVIRGVFLLCLIGIVLSYIMNTPEEDIRSIGQGNQWLVFHKPSALLAIVAVGVLIIGFDILISRKSLSSISGLFLGLLAGMMLAFVFSMVIDLVIGAVASNLREPLYSTVIREVKGKPVLQTVVTSYRDAPIVSSTKLLIGIICCYLSISFIIQTKDDIRFVIPYVEFAKQVKGVRPMLLDTSVIIDGRIADIAESGLIDSQLVVPRFVLSELQAIADSSD